jgi:hypothetical protein
MDRHELPNMHYYVQYLDCVQRLQKENTNVTRTS